MSEIMPTETLFQEIWNDLNASMSALENGGSIDMASLDNKVRYFCQTVTGLAPEEAKKYQEKMQAIITHLSELVTKLTERKEAVNGEIDMVDQRHRARMAYGNSSLYTSGEE